MSSFDWKEVRFDIFCQTCVYKDVRDDLGKEPCNSCMEEFARKHSTKPVNYRSMFDKVRDSKQKLSKTQPNHSRG